MPWRLILFLLVLTIVVLFAGFNITNVADISFGIWTLHQVPIFLSLFIAFLVGCFVMLPFAVRRRSAKVTTKTSRQVKQNAEVEPTVDGAEPAPAPATKPAKKRK